MSVPPSATGTWPGHATGPISYDSPCGATTLGTRSGTRLEGAREGIHGNIAPSP
jgi:hypothetical protein